MSAKQYCDCDLIRHNVVLYLLFKRGWDQKKLQKTKRKKFLRPTIKLTSFNISFYYYSFGIMIKKDNPKPLTTLLKILKKQISYYVVYITLRVVYTWVRWGRSGLLERWEQSLRYWRVLRIVPAEPVSMVETASPHHRLLLPVRGTESLQTYHCGYCK